MKRLLYTLTSLFFVASILFANPYSVFADEGDGGVHGLEVEVNGYHITLANPNEWAKGENTVIVTIADEMGMPLTDMEVELLIAPKTAGAHGESEAEGHAAPEADIHAPEPEGHDSMPDMDMGEATEEVDDHETSSHEEPAHDEEETSNLVVMRETNEHGMYVAETHLKNAGEHDALVMFHVDGEMIEAAFTVEIPGTNSKTVVLWSFALINTTLIASAGYIKKQSIPAKGEK
jgi:hypothetical protein